MWDNRSCDAVSRPMNELTHITELLFAMATKLARGLVTLTLDLDGQLFHKMN